MLNGTSDQVYEDWFLDLLIDWHTNDPVVQAEIDRNNAAYNFQGNANPFVDHPEFVNMIWNPSPDTQAPSAPTNLVASNPTSSTIDLSWTASTDNVGVDSYDIYVDGVNTYNTTNTTFTATGLTSGTNFCFTVYAKDAAGNVSTVSNQDCEMTLTSGGGSECISETFGNIPASSSSYSTRNWTGDSGGSWTATDARTDQTLNGKAITIRNGSLTAPANVNGGIGSFTVKTQRVFGGGSGTFNLKVNGNIVGTIAYSDIQQTITVSNINVTGNISVIIDGNSNGSNRVIFDDLSWTCYAPLSNNNFNLKKVSISPNPTKTGKINIITSEELQLKIYDILGKLIQTKLITHDSKTVNVSNLNKGIYLVKLSKNTQRVNKKLIIQ